MSLARSVLPMAFCFRACQAQTAGRNRVVLCARPNCRMSRKRGEGQAEALTAARAL